jgi:hypothetical protein
MFSVAMLLALAGPGCDIYQQQYVAPVRTYTRTYYTPPANYGYSQNYGHQNNNAIVKEFQILPTVPADYAGGAYAGQQLKEKAKAEALAEIRLEQAVKDAAETKALLLQYLQSGGTLPGGRSQTPPAGSIPLGIYTDERTGRLTGVDNRPLGLAQPTRQYAQPIPNWDGAPPAQQLTLPQKQQPSPQGGWPTPSPPSINPALPPPLDPGPSGGALVVPPDAQTLAMLEQKCAKCHNPEVARKNLVLFNGPGQLAPLSHEQLGKIYEQIDAGNMPPPEENSPVSPQEFAGIREWMAANPAALVALFRQRR